MGRKIIEMFFKDKRVLWFCVVCFDVSLSFLLLLLLCFVLNKFGEEPYSSSSSSLLR